MNKHSGLVVKKFAKLQNTCFLYIQPIEESIKRIYCVQNKVTSLYLVKEL